MSAPPSPAFARAWRLSAILVLGFASGLPLALTGQAMQAWLTTAGLDVATIGFLSLVGLPYTFKFLWAPLMDRFDPLAWLGRRRGWLVLSQLALAGALVALAAVPPQGALQAFALLALTVAFLSASQDVVIDAYGTDLLPPAERGLGSSLKVAGYRLAMILSGGVALIWTDAATGSGWTWPEVYRLMAGLMAGAAVFSALALPRLVPLPAPAEAAATPAVSVRTDLQGFAAVMAAVACGDLLPEEGDQWGPRLAALLERPELAPWFGPGLDVLTEAPLIRTDGSTRRPDRIVRSAQGWGVLDIKTGDPLPAHADQVRGYMHMLHTVTGTPVHGALLHLATGTLEPVA
ncbi:MAG: hypothetical protein HUU33_15605 [Flavobacteriales bacterium]|nr:hypothetical protein [Flavobacteriales bacterium]